MTGGASPATGPPGTQSSMSPAGSKLKVTDTSAQPLEGQTGQKAKGPPLHTQRNPIPGNYAW